MRNIGWIVLGALLIVFISAVLYYFVHPMFGGSFSGTRLERMKQSPNFKNGVFHNLEVTPSLKSDANMAALLWDFLFNKNPHFETDRCIASYSMRFAASSSR